MEQDAALLPTNVETNDDWAEDTSAEAVAARMKELAVSGAVAKLMDEDNDDDQGNNPFDNNNRHQCI